jgi:cytidylate kinase
MGPATDARTPTSEGWLVVIDGPAGAGKSTIARRVAQRLGVVLLDTGALYRTLALVATRRDVAWDDEAGLVALAADLPVHFEESDAGQRVMLGDEDVSAAIRTPHISEGASQVSAHPQVRTALLDVQRAVGATGCVAEGRDMGTVVFPDAPHKFFLTADLTTRARRRLVDLQKAHGDEAPTLGELEQAISVRDARDAERAVAPLRAAADAIVINSSRQSATEVYAAILRHLGVDDDGAVGAQAPPAGDG